MAVQRTAAQQHQLQTQQLQQQQQQQLHNQHQQQLQQQQQLRRSLKDAADAPKLLAHEAGEGGASEQLPLLLAALVVYTLASWLQERVSKAQEFNGPLLVLGETGGYVVLGLAWAYWEKGAEGVRSCLSLPRYLQFLPASMAFLAMNLIQYPSLRVFGVVNHSLLCQLNLVVMAVMLYCWKGQQVQWLQWAALLHLSIALVVLVVVTSANPEAAQAAAHAAFTTHDYMFALLAVATCIAASAFASIYLEATLKANAQDAIFVQMHQMNLVQAVVALALFLRGLLYSGRGAATGMSVLNLAFLAFCVTRGCMISFVLRRAGALANGAVSVATIVCVAVLQYALDGRRVAGLGLQITILLSVANYLLAEKRGKGVLQRGADSMVSIVLQGCLFASLALFVPYRKGSLVDGLLPLGKHLHH